MAFLPATQLTVDNHLCMMVEAEAKAGKSRSIGASLIALAGRIAIIECGTDSSLQPLFEITKNFDYKLVRTENEMEECIRAARDGVKSGQYKGIFLDDFNLYGMELHKIIYKHYAGLVRGGGEPDGRPIWWEWRRRMTNVIGRLMDIKCHFVMACHPHSFMGAADNEIPGAFSDVVHMRKQNKKGAKDGDEDAPIERVFRINCDANVGRGSRSLPGRHEIEADVGVFWKLVQAHRKNPKTPSTKTRTSSSNNSSSSSSSHNTQREQRR